MILPDMSARGRRSPADCRDLAVRPGKRNPSRNPKTWSGLQTRLLSHDFGFISWLLTLAGVLGGSIYSASCSSVRSSHAAACEAKRANAVSSQQQCLLTGRLYRQIAQLPRGDEFRPLPPSESALP